MITYPDLTQFCTFIPASNEPSGHACMSIWRLPRGQIPRWETSGYLTVALVGLVYEITRDKRNLLTDVKHYF